MLKAAHGIASMTLVGEDLPQPENRVTLGTEKDPFWVPVARTVHAFAPDTLRLYEAAMSEGIKVLQAAGAAEAWHRPMAQQHIMGGTIMGDDASGSFANGFGQTHDIPNLFIAGPRLFPTTGAVNPTFTIHALALRSAEFMLAHWSGFI
jgi:choline dehydrogenase-like flavoprotein